MFNTHTFLVIVLLKDATFLLLGAVESYGPFYWGDLH